MAEENTNQEQPAKEGQELSQEEAERAGFVERIKDAWRDTVGTYATSEAETKNLFGRLVDFGTLSKDEAMKILSEVGGRIEENRKELDKRVDESIHRATTLFAIPSPADVKALEAQVDTLERRIAELEQR